MCTIHEQFRNEKNLKCMESERKKNIALGNVWPYTDVRAKAYTHIHFQKPQKNNSNKWQYNLICYLSFSLLRVSLTKKTNRRTFLVLRLYAVATYKYTNDTCTHIEMHLKLWLENVQHYINSYVTCEIWGTTNIE